MKISLVTWLVITGVTLFTASTVIITYSIDIDKYK